jgi:hypothetical protein
MSRIFLAAILVTSCLFIPIRAADAPASAEIIRIPIECEDMQAVQWGPQGFTPVWAAGRWSRDLHQKHGLRRRLGQPNGGGGLRRKRHAFRSASGRFGSQGRPF